MCSHHPKCTPWIMPESLYQDKKNITDKKQKRIAIPYNVLIRFKPENMELLEFLRKCLTTYREDKFIFPNIETINFKKDDYQWADTLDNFHIE